MKILVTGGSGFVGHHFLSQLGHAEAVFSPSSQDLDVRDYGSVVAAFRHFQPDLCVHLAAQASQRRAQTDPEGTQAVNVQGTATILEAAGPKCRVVLFSSCHVPGNPQALPMKEEHPTLGQGAYALSKIAAERVAQGRLDRDWVLARLFNLTGPGQDRHFAASDWAQQWVAGKRRIQTGDLSLRRDYLDVRDACSAVLCLAEKARSRQTINICSGEAIALSELFAWAAPYAEALQDQTRFRREEPRIIQGCSERLRSMGWAPQISIQQSLSDLRAGISSRS